MRGRAVWGFHGLGVNLHGSYAIPVSRCRFVNFRYRQHPPPPVKFPLPHKKNEKNEKKRCGAHISSTITTTTHTHNLHPSRSPFFIRSSLATPSAPPSTTTISQRPSDHTLKRRRSSLSTEPSYLHLEEPPATSGCRLLRYRLVRNPKTWSSRPSRLLPQRSR
jgi:hypothetical protein